MRARLIKPDFFEDEELCAIPAGARLLFIGLWCLADREGRLLDIPKRIAIDIFPYEELEETVDKWLDLLAQRWITRYEGDGKKCISVNAFTRHQKPHIHEKKSALPPPPKRPPVQCTANVGTLADQCTANVLPMYSQCSPEAEAEAEAVSGISGRTVLDLNQNVDDVEDIAHRMFKRHPNRERAGTLKTVMDAVVEVLADAVHPDSLATKLDRCHQQRCKSRGWTKDSGEFVPGLAKWIKSGEWGDDEPVAEERGQYRPVSEVLKGIRGEA